MNATNSTGLTVTRTDAAYMPDGFYLDVTDSSGVSWTVEREAGAADWSACKLDGGLFSPLHAGTPEGALERIREHIALNPA